MHTSEQAEELVELVRSTGNVFGVTYNYTGYPLVRHARDMVANGELGELRKVVVQYSQGWLATRLEASGNKQAEWRTDPARSGIAGAIGRHRLARREPCCDDHRPAHHPRQRRRRDRRPGPPAR